MPSTHSNDRQNKKSPHIELTPSDVLELWRERHYTPKGYLYHLVLAHRRAGWWFKIDNVAQFCRDWDIPRRTFYRAKATLIDEGRLEEDIIGAVNVRVPIDSTDVCATSGTGVSEVALAVPDLALAVPNLAPLVPNGSHMSPETQSEQGLHNPTDLSHLSYRSSTPCVCVDESVENPAPTNGEYFSSGRANPEMRDSQVKNAEIDNEANITEKDPPAAPPNLDRLEKIGVNLGDRSLQKAIQAWPDRVPVAIACLEEKKGTVKHPTRFLTAAIEQDWKPEKNNATPPGFGDWFDDARRRGFVIASQMQGNGLVVCTSNGHWLPYERVRHLSWDELSTWIHAADAATVDREAVPARRE